jgi:hypothetical protein
LLAAAALLARLSWAGAVPVTIAAESPPPPPTPGHRLADPCAQGALGNDRMGRRQHCAGLTSYAFQPEVQVAYDDAPDGAKNATAWIDEVRVQFSLGLSMEVTAFYPAGSCPYVVTLAHETGHWNDYRAIQRSAAAGLRADLEKAGLPSKDSPARLPAKGIAAFEKKTTAKIAALFTARRDDFLRRAKAAAAKRDSPYSYQKNDVTKCPSSDWITSVP